MRKIDRFDIYMKARELNDNKVTVQLGLSIGTLGKSRKEGRDLSDRVIEQILNFYTDLNKVWLLTGEGEMLKGGTQGEAGGVTIPASVWNVIEKQAESLAARDRQMELLMKSRDEQINQLISTVRREIADLKKTYVHTEAATFADAG